MKRIALLAACLSGSLLAGAQWTRLPAFTDVHLLDAAFADADSGLVVGDKGAVYLTLNGGGEWKPVSPARDYHYTSATALSGLEYFVSGYQTYDDGSGTTVLFHTSDGGGNWKEVSRYGQIGERSQVRWDGRNLWWLSAWKGLQKSSDRGVTWNLEFKGGGNTVLSDVKTDPADPESVFVFGVIGGFATYTGTFRHIEKGQPWDGCDPFRFGSAAAYTAFDLINDTVILFRNNFRGFMPDDTSNVLSLAYDFVRDDILPGQGTGDTVWHFNTRIINQDIPHYVNDCRFFSLTGLGYSVEEVGGINRTDDGGKTWTRVYEGREPLKALRMVSDSVGYAVGDNGTVIKLGTGGSGIPDHPAADANLRIYPSPAGGTVTVETGPFEGMTEVSVLDGSGRLVIGRTFTGNRFELDTSSWKPGIYWVVIRQGDRKTARRVVRIE